MDYFIIPREIGDFFRVAMIPEFPSLYKRNPGDVFKASYSCDDFFVHVDITDGIERLDYAGLSMKDLKFIDTKFQHSIGNWLMDKKARSGNDQITGDIDTLAKDIYGGHKVRHEDKEKMLINLKSLSVLDYDIYFKSGNKEQEHFFRLIDGLNYDEDKRDFVAILEENLVPQVVNNDTYGKGLGPYTSKTPQDLYPGQGRCEFNMRQYLATIKNNEFTIPKTGGDYLLNQFGYRSHCKQFDQKYRNDKAEILLEYTYKQIAQEYDITFECHKGTASLKDIRDRFYSTHLPKNAVNASIPPQEKDIFIQELARFIKETGGKTYVNEELYISKAKQLMRKYPVEEIKNIYENNRKADPKFTIGDLQGILKVLSESPKDTLKA